MRGVFQIQRVFGSHTPKFAISASAVAGIASAIAVANAPARDARHAFTSSATDAIVTIDASTSVIMPASAIVGQAPWAGAVSPRAANRK